MTTAQDTRPLFQVTYEDVTFLSSVPDIDVTTVEAKALTERVKSAHPFPAHITAITGVLLSEDDGEQDGEVKCFISVTLSMYADDEESAEHDAVPTALLKAIAEAVDPVMSAGCEGNWAVNEVY
ncbi:hypothetical protein WJ97_12125 [Burkholderia ubonensis]|uniref:hypothetical protein n=1 Tax=Burkholderia ubonensis TaxID=101571 RepID=UPI0007589B68|nr:hypothetical protein [Burkholderia ubonensis]KVP96624.1 hypothetical protein WJ97_12125 [Burkholderia ubonensis]